MFLKNKKNLLVSLIASLALFVGGCSSNQNTVKQSSTVSSSNISTNSHTSAISNKIDINNIGNNVIKATVDRVVDGDTVEIILPSGEEVDTRLLLIDTPETKHPNLGVQKFGPEASEFAKSVLQQGDTVYFELDGKSKTDKYGRYLGYLWYTCPEHSTVEMYNERVVEEGLARVGYIYDQTKHLDALLETETVAKNNKANIWSIDGYVTDKGFDMSKVDTSSDIDSSPNDTSSGDSSEVVYLNGGKSSSNVFHKSSNAHGMKGAVKTTKKDAIDKGYTPCSSCFK
ncbi:nuclease [Romboutsia weinsteinii]|uniref:Nuclease n=1 Tax=Romboutsia weinsteinii TaxID=2020949 RepID=A0A371J6A4_9FIRM|nr:thermonuclease family protein [Romboutsia weinsteinii]RDY28198.1 nuclease [Romboutsia weinsteinii]